jgi:hypothetical protein
LEVVDIIFRNAIETQPLLLLYIPLGKSHYTPLLILLLLFAGKLSNPAEPYVSQEGVGMPPHYGSSTNKRTPIFKMSMTKGAISELAGNTSQIVLQTKLVISNHRSHL